MLQKNYFQKINWYSLPPIRILFSVVVNQIVAYTHNRAAPILKEQFTRSSDLPENYNLRCRRTDHTHTLSDFFSFPDLSKSFINLNVTSSVCWRNYVNLPTGDHDSILEIPLNWITFKCFVKHVIRLGKTASQMFGSKFQFLSLSKSLN